MGEGVPNSYSFFKERGCFFRRYFPGSFDFSREACFGRGSFLSEDIIFEGSFQARGCFFLLFSPGDFEFHRGLGFVCK